MNEHEGLIELCDRCGWAISGHVSSTYGLDCPMSPRPGFRRSEVPEPSAETVLHLTDSLKMLRESLCAVQLGAAGAERMTHADRIGRIISEIDRQRPLGSNGKHGDLHTSTCGCSGSEPQGEPSDDDLTKLANDAHHRMVDDAEADGGWYVFSHSRDAWQDGFETGYRARAAGGVR